MIRPIGDRELADDLDLQGSIGVVAILKITFQEWVSGNVLQVFIDLVSLARGRWFATKEFDVYQDAIRLQF